MGDGSDKLVTVDVRPDSVTYGKVVDAVSVGGRNEAHHAGFTDDRRYYWLGGLDTSKIFIFDVHTDPAKPKLTRVINDFVSKTGGVVGPHTFYALPGRMLISALSNSEDHGGRTALVEYSNDGNYISTHWMPTSEHPEGAAIEKVADGFGYDVRVQPRLNAFLTSSFTGWNNYMEDFGKLLKDKDALTHFGQNVVVWNLHTMQPEKVLEVPGSPLEIRWALEPDHNYAFTSTALTSKIWLIYQDKNHQWHSRAVADIGNPDELPLPVDISLSANDKRLWVNTFEDGMTRLFDVSDPFHPRKIYSKKIGSQVNMVSESWDGKRVYYTSSLLSRWDKKGSGDEQYLKGYTWDGHKLTKDFSIDFYKLKLGRAHIMRFGAYSLYGKDEHNKPLVVSNGREKVASSR
jgi:selenium-binding protein 1